MRELMRRAMHVLRRRRFEADLAEEMAFHRDMVAHELEQRGASAADAKSGARRTFGSGALAADQARDVWVPAWLRDIAFDFTFAVRRLTTDLRFTIAASVALGLGIGANLMVFTFINAIAFREVPFDRADELVWMASRDSRGRTAGFSYAEFLEYRSSLHTVAGLAATLSAPMNLSDNERAPERVQGTYVSANAFTLLRVVPVVGRGFLAEDDQPGAPAVVVIGHDLWATRYGGDPAVVGTTIKVNGVPATLVGVAPRDFRFPLIASAWQPLSQLPGLVSSAPARTLNPFGRLAAGATLDAARQDAARTSAVLAQEFPATNTGLTAEMQPMNRRGLGAISVLYTLMGAVAFVLLIACANVANLLLARAAHRAREIAIRSALGATRWRIVRQLLVESLVVATGGGIAGYAFSALGVRLFAVLFAVRELGGTVATLPYWLDLSGVDWRVFAFLGAVCALSTVLFGLAPALQVSRTNINDVLKDGGKGLAGRLRGRRWMSVLIVAELALTLVLLAGTGLLVRSFVAVYRAVAAVSSRDVVTARLALPLQKYATPAARLAFFDRLTERLAADAAIEEFAVASEMPFMPVPGAPRELTLDGQVTTPGDIQPSVSAVFVSPRYFAIVGLPLVRGRVLTDGDGTAGQATAIVNQRFASMFFPDANPVGRRLRLSAPGPAGAAAPPWLTIAGVVGNLPSLSADKEPAPVVYTPLRSDPGALRVASVLVRGRSDSTVTIAQVRDAVRRLDTDLPLYFVQTIADIVGQNAYSLRLFGEMVGMFAMIALVLASVGLYGVTAHSVIERTNEIGIRMALGAHSSEVAWMFVKRTLAHLAVGVPLGLAGALATGQLLRRFLVNTPARDPVTLAAVALLLVVVALLACLLPARRAARIDPVLALRYE
jgi:predicted permease